MKSASQARSAAQAAAVASVSQQHDWKVPVLVGIAVIKVWNESGTNRGRIGNSRRVRLRSLRHMALPRFHDTRWGIWRRFRHHFLTKKLTSAADRASKKSRGLCPVDNGDARSASSRASFLRHTAAFTASLVFTLAAARGGFAAEMNCVACTHPGANRRRQREAKRHQDPRAGDRRQPNFGITQLREILDGETIRARSRKSA